MVSASVPGVHGWGNLYSFLTLGAFGLSLRHGKGLRAPFLFGHGVAGMAAYMRPQGYISSAFLHPVQHNFPTKSRFLVRPQLLIRP